MTPYSLGARISPYLHPHHAAQSIALATVKKRAASDPHGDTIVAQINPREAAMLRAAGGADRVNPRTGLRSFYPGQGGAGGMGGDAGGEAGSDPGGLGGGGAKGGGGPGGRPTGPHDAGGYSVAGGGGYQPGGDAGLRGPLGPTGLPGHTSGTGYAGAPAPTGDYAGVGSAYRAAQATQSNLSTKDQILGAVLGLIPGFHYAEQPNPGLPGTYSGGTWHSGFNPGGFVGGIAGGAMAPGAGVLGSVLGGAAYNGLVGPDISFGSGALTPGMRGIGMTSGPTMGGTFGGSWGGSGTGSGVHAGVEGRMNDDRMVARQGAFQAGLPGPAPTPTPTPAPGTGGQTGAPAPGTSSPAPNLPPWTPPAQNPYMPWRPFMSYQSPADAGALPFQLPAQAAPWWQTAQNRIGG